MSVSLADLREARGIVAELAVNNPLLQPVFDRLDREYKAAFAAPKLTPAQAEARRRRDIRALA
ncbi:hypothetical protein SAMN04488103_102299 [Gemmobacter aquatilis]|uniref:Uncharacterized protein n=1 Tax=Gemmobacter aquatilis TaxID=933059 RepID=A0A1H8BWB9_9RHOB|nr:hypothetical protein [Gemmobacter aquatilis]SEM87086.1 hypothetical protein SAMN04488103_102299 [Gemmobacter aquatilis]